jgi:cyclopropane fatty-acyl-phospholipid synthase-like methyltransferase
MEYARLEGDEKWPRMRWIGELVTLVAPGSRVLDLGCGNGVPATRALAEQNSVLGVDISEQQIAWARRNVPATEFHVADVAALEMDTESFDAIVSLYMLGHIPRAEHPAILTRLFAWLRPGGHLLLSVEEEEEPDVVRPWLGRPMFFSSYDADKVIELIAAAGFEVLRHEAVEQNEGGEEVPFRWILARKPKHMDETGAGS